jgi:hypothetical protein
LAPKPLTSTAPPPTRTTTKGLPVARTAAISSRSAGARLAEGRSQASASCDASTAAETLASFGDGWTSRPKRRRAKWRGRSSAESGWRSQNDGTKGTPASREPGRVEAPGRIPQVHPLKRVPEGHDRLDHVLDVGDVLLPPTCLLSRAASVFKSIAPLMLARMLPDPIREAVIRFTYATGHGHVCVERGVFET